MILKEISSSYNNIIDALKCVCLSHGMVHTVSSGNADDIDINSNVVYPLVHIVPSSVSAGVQQITVSFNVLAMDLVKTDESNEQQVLSDTMQILIDVIAQYKNGLMLSVQQNTGIYGQADDISYTLEPFTERFDNVVAGWNMSFNIVMPATYFACSNFNDSATYDAAENTWTFINGGDIDCSNSSSTPVEDEPVVFPDKQTPAP